MRIVHPLIVIAVVVTHCALLNFSLNLTYLYQRLHYNMLQQYVLRRAFVVKHLFGLQGYLIESNFIEMRRTSIILVLQCI